MKRCCAFLCVLAALALCFSGAAAGYSMTAGYEVPELYLSLNLPLDWAVLTRDAEAGNPALFLYDDDPEYMRDVFDANNIYLDAFNFESLLELTILMTPNEDIFDLSLWDEDFVNKAADYFAENPVWAGSNDVQCFRIDDYYQSGARFLTYNRLETQDDVQLRCMQMTTVYNGQAIHLILTDYSGALSFDSGSLGAVMFDIVSTLSFTDVLAAPDDVTEDALGPAEIPYDHVDDALLVAFNVATGLLPVIIALIIIVIARSRTRRRGPTGHTPMRQTAGAPPQPPAVPAPKTSHPSASAQQASPPAIPAPRKPQKAAVATGRPVQPAPDRRPKHNCAEQDRAYSPKRRPSRRDETVFCIDCGRKVSIKDGRCPHCGARVV